MTLTIFSAPKPFVGHIGVIQKNAVKSWTLLGPEVKVILFGNEEGIAEAAQALGVQYVADLVRNEFGTPLLDDLFEKAQALSNEGLLCYVNADIILMSDFMRAVKRLLKKTNKKLVLGQRWDMDITESFDFGVGWEARLGNDVAKRGQLHSKTGIDYFLFSKGLWEIIPPFAIGRTAWDNWLIYEARRLGAQVIDATGVIKIVHQNHGYSHVKDGEQGAWHGPEAQRNSELAAGGIYTTEDVTWLLTWFGLVPAWSYGHLRRRLEVWLRQHSEVRNFLKKIIRYRRRIEH